MTDENTSQAGEPQTHGQKEFILRTFNHRYIQVEKIRAWFKEHQRNVGKPVLGMFKCVEGTGKFNKSIITLSGGNYSEHVRNSEELRDKFRRIRQQEAEELDKLDAAIRSMEDGLRMLRAEREGVVKNAFAKGHVVYLNEVRQVAEERLAERLAKQEVAKTN